MNYKLTISNLNRKKQAGRVTDGHRLIWQRNKNGTLTAFQRVTIEGKSKEIKIDTFYGQITAEQLKEARETGQKLRLQDSGEIQNNSITLKDAWTEFYNLMASTQNSNWSDSTAKDNKSRIETYIKPTKLWNMALNKIHVSDFYSILLPIRLHKKDTESKIRGVLSKVYRHYKPLKVVSENPLLELPDLYSNIEKPTKKKHLASVTDINELGTILIDNDYSTGAFMTRKALEFQAYTCQRSGEIVATKWEEIDLKDRLWTIPRERMKYKGREYDQVLELSDTAIKILESLPKRNDFVFPSNVAKAGHIHRDSMSKRIRETLERKGKHVPHGWRSSLKTLATQAADDEGRPLFAKEWIEATLDHEISDNDTERAYQREHPTKGVGFVLKWWAKQLDTVRQSQEYQS